MSFNIAWNHPETTMDLPAQNAKFANASNHPTPQPSHHLLLHCSGSHRPGKYAITDEEHSFLRLFLGKLSLFQLGLELVASLLPAAFLVDLFQGFLSVSLHATACQGREIEPNLSQDSLLLHPSTHPPSFPPSAHPPPTNPLIRTSTTHPFIHPPTRPLTQPSIHHLSTGWRWSLPSRPPPPAPFPPR